VERLIQKIGRINEYLKIIDTIKDECDVKFDKDPVYRGAMLHYLYLLTDTCIALAGMVIKKKNLRIPQSYAEAFDILGDSGVLDADFAYSFAKIAGFRNFLAHDYETIDSGVICTKVLASLTDIRKYIRQIQEGCDLQ
jgi:uncharacterized protein YutE (UPF0331/DUF86 family)